MPYTILSRHLFEAQTQPTANPELDSLKFDAEQLIIWLSMPTVEARHPGARLRAIYLRILVDSSTPDAAEIIADEIADIRKIVTQVVQE